MPSYTPTLSPVPRPRILNKERKTISFTQSPKDLQQVPLPNVKETRISTYEFPYGFVLIILCLLFVLIRINRRKRTTPNDTNHSSLQINRIYYLDTMESLRYRGISDRH